MRRHKAARPATDGAVNRPHTVSAGRRKRDAEKTFHPATQVGFLSIYAGQRCLGHLLPRGRQGVEAFDADDRSLGIFPDQKSAADAIGKTAGGAA
jgi:hypothetical protein